jgi:hypothetical protein
LPEPFVVVGGFGDPVVVLVPSSRYGDEGPVGVLVDEEPPGGVEVDESLVDGGVEVVVLITSILEKDVEVELEVEVDVTLVDGGGVVVSVLSLLDEELDGGGGGGGEVVEDDMVEVEEDELEGGGGGGVSVSVEPLEPDDAEDIGRLRSSEGGV